MATHRIIVSVLFFLLVQILSCLPATVRAEPPCQDKAIAAAHAATFLSASYDKGIAEVEIVFRDEEKMIVGRGTGEAPNAQLVPDPKRRSYAALMGAHALAQGDVITQVITLCKGKKK